MHNFKVPNNPLLKSFPLPPNSLLFTFSLFITYCLFFYQNSFSLPIIQKFLPSILFFGKKYNSLIIKPFSYQHCQKKLRATLQDERTNNERITNYKRSINLTYLILRYIHLSLSLCQIRNKNPKTLHFLQFKITSLLLPLSLQ